jgi:hypothetical protein
MGVFVPTQTHSLVGKAGTIILQREKGESLGHLHAISTSFLLRHFSTGFHVSHITTFFTLQLFLLLIRQAKLSFILFFIKHSAAKQKRNKTKA